MIKVPKEPGSAQALRAALEQIEQVHQPAEQQKQIGEQQPPVPSRFSVGDDRVLQLLAVIRKALLDTGLPRGIADVLVDYVGTASAADLSRLRATIGLGVKALRDGLHREGQIRGGVNTILQAVGTERNLYVDSMALRSIIEGVTQLSGGKSVATMAQMFEDCARDLGGEQMAGAIPAALNVPYDQRGRKNDFGLDQALATLGDSRLPDRGGRADDEARAILQEKLPAELSTALVDAVRTSGGEERARRIDALTRGYEQLDAGAKAVDRKGMDSLLDGFWRIGEHNRLNPDELKIALQGAMVASGATREQFQEALRDIAKDWIGSAFSDRAAWIDRAMKLLGTSLPEEVDTAVRKQGFAKQIASAGSWYEYEKILATAGSHVSDAEKDAYLAKSFLTGLSVSGPGEPHLSRIVRRASKPLELDAQQIQDAFAKGVGEPLRRQERLPPRYNWPKAVQAAVDENMEAELVGRYAAQLRFSGEKDKARRILQDYPQLNAEEVLSRLIVDGKDVFAIARERLDAPTAARVIDTLKRLYDGGPYTSSLGRFMSMHFDGRTLDAFEPALGKLA